MRMFLKIHPNDTVAVALKDLREGDLVEVDDIAIKLVSDVPQKHKFALHGVLKGEFITMYGVVVGVAKSQILQGEVIATHNLEHATSQDLNQTGPYTWSAPPIEGLSDSFMGYPRVDGNAGTANYWLVAPLVFCENRNIELIREALEVKLGYQPVNKSSIDVDQLIHKYLQGAGTRELLATNIGVDQEQQKKTRVFENIDGIKYLTHDAGCGGTREDARSLCRLLAGYVAHPNVGGATILSLGCQNAEVSILKDYIKEMAPNFDKPLHILGQQDFGRDSDFIAEAVKRTFVGLIEINNIQRQPFPLDHLTIGLECGGSDGFSGISANPAVGYFSDLLVAAGGSVILSEFPELHGVEHMLVRRCRNETIAERFLNLMKIYQNAAVNSGSGFDANPSPGNIKDGLITDAMKSAGAALKGGSSPVVDVLDYTDQVKVKGLNLLCTPGNDVESTTGLAGSGAQIILFTTGLGTPTGNPVASVIKISSNAALALKMPHLIDIDAGDIIKGKRNIESVGKEIFQEIISVASGLKTTKAQDLGQNDFIPWKRGISL